MGDLIDINVNLNIILLLCKVMERIPSYKEIFQIALPIMLGGISETISAIVDTAFMGKLGTLAMDGMGMANIFLLIIIMIGWSFSRSIQILVSQNFGAENFSNIGSIVQHALVVLFPIGLLLFGILYSSNAYFLKFIIDNDSIHKIASEVCSIRSYGMPIVMMTLVFSGFFTGLGQTKILLFSQAAAAISNIILNYILVFGKLGMPVMGYQGSATATVVSEGIALVVLLGYLAFQSDLLKRYELLIRKKFSLHLVREIMRLAAPMVVLHAFSLGSWVYFFSLIEKMGEKELAISMVLKQLFSAITIPGFCLASTANTIVGQLVGSRKIDLIMPSIWKVVKLNYTILISLAILTYIFRYPIVSLFTTDAAVITNISMPLIALLMAYLVIPSSNVLFNSISALGSTKIPLYLETINLFFYLLYMFVFIHIMKSSLFVAWLAEIEYWIFLLIFCFIYFYKMDWRKNIIYLDK